METEVGVCVERTGNLLGGGVKLKRQCAGLKVAVNIFAAILADADI